MKNVISIDFGTQSVRVAIINELGKILAIEQEKYDIPYFSLKPGYAEQDPNYYYDLMCKASKRLVEKNKELMNDVVSFSSTCFRDTAAFLDKDYKVIRPSIIWLDQRKAKLEHKIPLLYTLAFCVVGMNDTIILNRKRTPAIWLEENEPDNYAKIAHYAPLNSYFNYRILGRLADSPSNMIGHFPINFKTGKVYGKNAIKGCIFDIDPKLIPEIVPVGSVIGEVTEIGHKETGLPKGLKYIATGNDKSCEALGSGATEKGSVHVSMGTACSIAMTSKKYFEPIRFLPSYITAYKGYYSGEMQIYRGCWMLSWFAKEFGKEAIEEAEIEKIAPEHLLNKKILAIPPGSDGLVLQPFWGPQLERPLAKGSIIGFYDVHTKYHMYRSIIEGLGYCLKEGLESISKNCHQKPKYITIGGGGSKSNAICQILADIFNLPVYKPSNYEVSIIGCAMSQLVALNIYKDVEECKKACVEYETIYKPNPENAKKYEYLYKNVYKKVYPKLKSVYAELSEYLNMNNEGNE